MSALVVGPVELTDEQIAAMSAEQRRDLIWRLARPSEELLPARRTVRRIRNVRLAITAGSAVLLIPWIAYLGVTLPDHYVANNWSATWVGFDILLLFMFAATAVLGWLRRQLLILTGFASGVLLLCDAWFDLMTSGPGDLWESVASAALEIPIAILLIGGTVRLMRFMAARFWFLEPGMHIWQLPLAVSRLRYRDGRVTRSWSKQ
ncbi:MAG: hypothetical protein V7603_3538 [Micromonosporaceae bacterium]